MATTTRALLRKQLGENINDFYEQTAPTSNGAGDGTTIVDTGLIHEVGGGDNDAFLGWYAMVTESGHGAVGEIRRVKTYTASSGTLTLESTGFSAAVNTTHTYELHRIDPRIKHLAINQAIEQTYPTLHLPIVDESLIVDNLLAGADMETSGQTEWTQALNGGGAIADVSDIVFHGAQSLKITSGGGPSLDQMTQLFTSGDRETENFVQQQAKFWCWVFTGSLSDVGRIRIDWDGTDIISSDFQSGNRGWELLKVEGAVPDTATQVKAILESAAGANAAFFDASRLSMGPVYRYTIPTTIRDLLWVYQQGDELDEVGSFIPVTPWNPIREMRRLRLVGMAPLSTVSTDAGTTEVAGDQEQLLLAYAEFRLWRLIAIQAGEQDRARYNEDANTALQLYISMVPNSQSQPMGAQRRHRIWHTEHDGSGHYLILDVPRG